MESVQITSMSTRGQIVIPQNLRDKMNLIEGEKFIVIGENDTIILKKIAMPSFERFDSLLKKTREHAKNNKISTQTVKNAIKNTRKKLK